MSYSERPSAPEAFSAETGHGAATATDPQPDMTASQDNAPQDNTPQDNAPQDNTPQDNADDGRTSRAPSDGQLRPDARADDPVAALWGADLVEGYRTRWQALQLGFVDDPQGSTHDAARLVDEAVQALTNALATQKHTLDQWQGADRADTEVLRTALQNYREFLDRLLGV